MVHARWTYQHKGSWTPASLATHDAMAAYYFAKKWSGRNIDMRALQRVVLRANIPMAAYLFARNIPGAQVRKLQKIILDSGDAEMMRKFAKEIPGADVTWLENIACVTEIMDL